jgi:hypothetical protein
MVTRFKRFTLKMVGLMALSAVVVTTVAGCSNQSEVVCCAEGPLKDETVAIFEADLVVWAEVVWGNGQSVEIEIDELIKGEPVAQKLKVNMNNFVAPPLDSKALFVLSGSNPLTVMVDPSKPYLTPRRAKHALLSGSLTLDPPTVDDIESVVPFAVSAVELTVLPSVHGGLARVKSIGEVYAGSAPDIDAILLVSEGVSWDFTRAELSGVFVMEFDETGFWVVLVEPFDEATAKKVDWSNLGENVEPHEHDDH